MAGPYDTVPRCKQIISALERYAGPGNYHYMMPMPEKVLFSEQESLTRIKDSANRAMELIENGDLDQAQNILNMLMKKYPEHPDVLFAMGNLYYGKDMFDDALHYFDAAIEVSPGFLEAMNNKAATHQKRAEILHMLKTFQLIIETGPPDDPAVQNARKELERSEAFIEETEGVDLKTYMEAYELFDSGYAHMEKGEFEQAIELFQQSISLNDNSPKPYGNMGLCYAMLGNKQMALEALEKALLIDPSYEIALGNLKLIKLMQEGQPLQADTNFEFNPRTGPILKKKSFMERLFRK
ncbi:MAG: tetratricopeptide repeat protein [SAR324 cluster bacterium]|nr:tetratricopeptide repeat protein [SAR324 cluster bacterium]